MSRSPSCQPRSVSGTRRETRSTAPVARGYEPLFLVRKPIAEPVSEADPVAGREPCARSVPTERLPRHASVPLPDGSALPAASPTTTRRTCTRPRRPRRERRGCRPGRARIERAVTAADSGTSHSQCPPRGRLRAVAPSSRHFSADRLQRLPPTSGAPAPSALAPLHRRCRRTRKLGPDPLAD